MTKPIPSVVFRTALRERQTSHPFERVSGYKVRDSWYNLAHECAVVASIGEFLRASPGYYRSSILLGCTEEDKAHRLKRIPSGIAHELGYNLIPAIEALTLEGIPRAAIIAFLGSIMPRVEPLMRDCDAVQSATAKSVQEEYSALRGRRSHTAIICAEALEIAEEAVRFCKQHGAL